MSNTYSNLLAHLVWGTKDRHSYITKAIKQRFHMYICGIVKNQDCIVLGINGMPDHIHLLAKIPPKHSVSFIMQQVKVHSSGFYRKKLVPNSNFSWQEGYGAFSVSESVVPAVIRYIENQEEHHKNKSYDDEFALFMRKYIS